MRPIYILTISFIVLLQIENGENANTTSTEKGDDHEQGSLATTFPNNVTNQEQITESSTSSFPNTDNRTSVSNITFSDLPIVNTHPPTTVPSFSSENEVPVSEKSGRDKDNFNVSEEPNVTPLINTTVDLSDRGTTSTSRQNSEQPNSDMYTSQTLTKVMSDSTQTTTSNQTVAVENIEIYGITTERINSTCIYLMWEINQAGNYTFKIKPGNLDVVASNLTRFKEIVCSNKLPGKVVNYKIKLFLWDNNVKEKSKRVHFEPSTPTNLNYSINNTLSWKEGNGNTDYYELRYLTNNKELVQEVNDTKFNLEEVIPGETLNISLYAVRNFRKYNFTVKSEPVFKEITTIPLRPEVKIEQNLKSIDVLIQSGTGYRDAYMITLNLNTTLNYNVPRSNMDKLYKYNIPDLTPAQYYDITVVSFSNGIKSQPATTRTSTCPQIHSVNVENITSTSFVVNWKGDYNNETITEVHINDTKHLAPNSDQIDINNLESTTVYSVAVSLSFNGCNVTSDTIHEFTMDAHLKPIENVLWGFEKSKNKLELSWKPPVNAKNTIRSYEVNFEDLNSNIEINQSLNATQTDFKATYGECYNVLIAGVNKAGRGELFSQYIYIPEDVPETVSYVTPINIQSTSVRIQWKEPAVFKGTIIKYTVVLNDSNNLTSVKKTVQCDESCYKSHCLNTNLRRQRNVLNMNSFRNGVNKFEVVFEDLKPYQNYSVAITAFTRTNESEPVHFHFMTEEDIPGRIDEIVAEVNSSDATIKWKPPTEPNGVILSYNIELLDNNRFKDSKNTTDTSVTFYNLQQVTEYSVRIKAITSKGYGNFSDLLRLITKLKVPSKPENVKVVNKTSTSLTLVWTRPANDLNISYYVQVNDTVWEKEVKNITCGTHSSCHVPGLKPFWNYSLQVNVANNEGSSSSEIIKIQTLEDKPGKVSKFEAKPESDISEPRTISLEWDPPKQEDRNGKIINYAISYGQDLENKKEIKIGLQTQYILRDIFTDVQYEIELAAVTIIGTGVKDTRRVIVPPGILPKPIEVIPLIKHLPAHLVQDKRHQIPLQLPFGFLCNTSYGEIISRGILATRGTRYVIPEMKSRPSYPSWYEAKDSKTLLTYQVSSLPSLKNCRYEEGHKIFIVGNDKDCKNIPGKYCNGNLLPDTLYRFKIFICTKAGCTYSNFSYPIKTDKVSNTVLISCIVVLIVCIVIAVTAFLLYRKKACFAVFDGDGERNNFDLRVYKSNRNRPVKLSKFEAHVQSYHQNTNIGFSEEYKVIKQLSPKYSTKAAERESCRIKNRYTNVLPFDSTRVKLLPVDDEEDSEYINANYIPGYNGKREYIAAQGPLPSTTDDFWRMLWENQVSVVVMLTNCMEKGRVKCEKYWPDSCDPVHYGDLVVHLRSESNLPDYNIRVLDIKLGMKTRTIKQFHFLKWPDFGCPEKTWLLLNFVTSVRAHLSNSSTGPIVVHCSAGVGRTGTFIAVDMLLQQIHDSEEIDIFGLVLEMRENRSLMVQTENQYIYIHDCIRDALIDDPDEEEEIDEHIYENQVIYENS